MSKLKFFLLIGLIATVSIFTTTAACYWIAEHFFFDKFFYHKSVAHGYWVSPETGYQGLADFGHRGSDMLGLMRIIFEGKESKVLGVQATNQFTIAVFGDSYVWGLGVRENERLSALLEEKLNHYRPTKVLTFAVEGDNLIDHWRKYKALRDSGQKIDLLILGIVHNDAFIKKNSWYGLADQDLVDQCQGRVILDVSEDIEEHRFVDVYPQRVLQSLEPDTKNYCIVQEFIPKFPKEHALYVSLDSLLTTDPKSLKMTELWQKAGYPVLTFKTIAPDLSPEQETLFVSQKERHPSARAHRLFAAGIADILLKDPRFGFINN